MDLSAIDPIYFDKSYYLAPQRGVGAEKSYALLLRAMEEANRVGIARFVLRSKEYLSAIRPIGGAMMLETLFFADEVRDISEVDNVPTGLEISERELDIATQLIGFLAREWEPSRYRDKYREKVLELIEAKAEDEPVVVEREPEGSRIPDLMAALKASVEAAKDNKDKRRRGGRKTG